MRELDADGFTVQDKIVISHFQEYGYTFKRVIPPIGDHLLIINSDENHMAISDTDFTNFQTPEELRMALQGVFQYQYEKNKLGMAPNLEKI